VKDTTPKMEARFHEMLMRRSPEERARMCLDMFDSARALVVAGLKEQGLKPGTLEFAKALLLRTYGDQLTLEQVRRWEKGAARRMREQG
jgi:hypothetical protein